MRTLPITRSDGIAIKVAVANRSELDSAVNLLDGVDCINQLSDLIKTRFGTRIVVDKDTDGNSVVKLVEGKAAQGVDLDRYETIYTGAFRRLVKVKASNFTSKDQTWTLSLPGEEEAPAEPLPAPKVPTAPTTPAPGPEPETMGEDGAPVAAPVPAQPADPVEAPAKPVDEKSEALVHAEEVLDDYRTAGKAHLSLIRVDRLSVALKIAYLRILWRSGKLVYEPVYPQNIYFAFPRTVSDGPDSSRASVTTELEDACAVVIEAAETRTALEEDGEGTSDTTSTFIAYMGRSEAYPDGRHLVWSGENWYDIPDPGDKSIIEEYEGGNPLTKWGNDNPEYEAIEYPIVPFYGTDAASADSLLPTQSLDLPRTMIELETTASRCLSALSDAARGTWVFTQGVNTPSLTAGFKNMTTSMIMCEVDQNATHVSLGAQEALTALEGVGQLLRMVAENHDVPGYQVTPDDTSAPESGIKLAIETKPQTDDRAERAEQTGHSIERMWQIEKALLDLYAPDDQKIPLDAVLSWDPGTLEIPESETDRVTNIKAMQDAGYIDQIEAVRRVHRLTSRAEAEDLLESMDNPKAAKTGNTGGWSMGGLDL